eukprot:5674140-Pyramimonas_sp.AAC.1
MPSTIASNPLSAALSRIPSSMLPQAPKLMRLIIQDLPRKKQNARRSRILFAISRAGVKVLD